LNARPGRRGVFTHQESILRFDDGLAWLIQVTITDSCGLGGTPWGRVDYLGHVSLIGWDQADRHDLSRVFFIAVTSVVLQGTAIPFLARVLKIDATPSEDVTSRLLLDPREPDDPIVLAAPGLATSVYGSSATTSRTGFVLSPSSARML